MRSACISSGTLILVGDTNLKVDVIGAGCTCLALELGDGPDCVACSVGGELVEVCITKLACLVGIFDPEDYC